MLVTQRSEWADLFRSLRNQGRDVFDAWLNHSRLGYNYRLDEMSAALGVAQMGRIDELLDSRSRVAAWYSERITAVPGLNPPFIAPTTTRMSWFVYVIRCFDSKTRAHLIEFLQNQGIPSRPYFSPIHLQPYYRNQFGWSRGDLPCTEAVGDTALALPFSGVMTEAQVDYVCQALKRFMLQYASAQGIAE